MIKWKYTLKDHEDHSFEKLKSTNEFYLVDLVLKVELFLRCLKIIYNEVKVSTGSYYCSGKSRTEFSCLSDF